jgi:hypothetical protein
MRYASIALLSAATAFVLPLATPAIAQVGSTEIYHPSGCLSCPPVTIHPYGTQGYPYSGVPAIGSEPGLGVPTGAVALAPESRIAGFPRTNRRHAEVRERTWGHPSRYTATHP